MPTTPPSITGLPAAPDPNDRSTFNARAYPWSAALSTFSTQVSAVADNVKANADEAEADAVAAAAAQLAAEQAQAAAESASSATKWISGTSYAEGAVVWSPADFASYRRKTAGAGTTDPSADTTNWASIGGAGGAGITRSARTSNTILGKADKGKLIDITSGTFTQTFAACATLADGWWCYIRNSGTGDITLDPNASETIDGLTSFVMYPGEVRLLQCDGTALRSVVLAAFYKTFTTSGTFTKPPGYSVFEGLMWGGGGSGRRGAGGTSRAGGGGGGCVMLMVSSASLSVSTSVTIGSGGAAVAVNTTDGNPGGNSTFSVATAYGGKGGTGDGLSTNYANGAGGSSGVIVSDLSATAGSDASIAGASWQKHTLYGGGAGISDGVYGGGSTVYGGGGGTELNAAGAEQVTTTTFGGAGGGVATAGSAPGGGGGCSTNGTNSGAGARGELRIWGVL